MLERLRQERETLVLCKILMRVKTQLNIENSQHTTNNHNNHKQPQHRPYHSLLNSDTLKIKY